jgi:hypothetical protein
MPMNFPMMVFAMKGALQGYVCASLERDLFLFGKKLRFGGASEQRRKRLFNKRFYDWNTSAVHEDVVWIRQDLQPNSQQSLVYLLDGKVHHHSWKSISHWIDATNRRSDVQAVQRHAALNARSQLSNKSNGFLGMSVGASILLRFFFEFFRSYFLRLGFLDGLRGFVFCFLMAFSQELKLIKVYEKSFEK